MGQLNLFASTLTSTMEQFTSTYKDGILRPVAAVRLLDENPFPHASIVVDTLPYSYILIEVVDPLTYKDIDFLYRSIMVGETEYTKESARRYARDRILNATPGRRYRTFADNDDELEKLRDFRRRLEAAALAFKHLKSTYRGSNAHIDVQKIGSMFVIEYDGEIHRRTREGDARRTRERHQASA